MMTFDTTRVLITVQLVDDGYELAYLFAFVTGLFAMLAGLIAYIDGWIEDITEAVIFTGKVVTIAVKSLAFGLGVT
jgi:hypothetical protein